MESVKASALQAAVSITAGLVLNDGKYEQWEQTFFKALNAATAPTVKWQDKGWTESSRPNVNKKKPPLPLHVLKFKSGKNVLTLQFTETKTGYAFAYGDLNDGRGSSNFYDKAWAVSQATVVNSGNDIISLVVKWMGLAPAAPPPDLATVKWQGVWSVHAVTLDDQGDEDEDVNTYVRAKNKADALKKVKAFLAKAPEIVNGRNPKFEVRDAYPLTLDMVNEVFAEGIDLKDDITKLDQAGYFIYDMGT